MRLRECTYNLAFDPNPDIRKAFFDLEESYRSLGLPPFTLVSLPEDAPLDIPRIVAAAPGGPLQIAVSMLNAQVGLTYGGLSRPPEDLQLVDLRKEADRIYGVLESVLDGFHPQYSGVMAGIELPRAQTGEPVAYLRDRFASVESDLEMDELSTKLAYRYRDTYYLNVSFGRSYVFDEPVSLPPTRDQIANADQVVRIDLDFNDRLAFNREDRETYGSGEIEKLFDIFQDYLDNGLSKLLNEKRVEL